MPDPLANAAVAVSEDRMLAALAALEHRLTERIIVLERKVAKLPDPDKIARL